MRHERDDRRTPPVDQSLFEIGQATATPTALETLATLGLDPVPFILRHAQGDWGDDVSNDDWAANDRAVLQGERILSSYKLPDTEERLWILTEADRSYTTVLLPSDY